MQRAGCGKVTGTLCMKSELNKECVFSLFVSTLVLEVYI